MVPVPIPETYTVPQSYQPRRPDPAPQPDFAHGETRVPRQEADSWRPDPPFDAARAPHAGPIPVAPPRVDPAPAAHGASPSPDWNHYLAAGAFLAAGALLATGHRRLGIAAAAAGAATVLLEDAGAVTAFCQQAPAYLSEAHSLIRQVQELLHGSFAAVEAIRQT